MKCQICHKYDANIVFTQILNNEKVVLHICGECAKEKGITIDLKKPSQPKTIETFNPTVQDDNSADEIENDLTCDECGLSFAEFKRDGLFGCSHCHITFGEYVDKLLKQIHGACVYHGKQPDEISEEGKKLRELANLKNELRNCIESEEYERAATLRDRIAEIEGMCER